MSSPAQTMYATTSFVILSLFSIWGVLYAFWLSFEVYPVDSRVWIPQVDRVCALPPSSLSVKLLGDSTFVCLRAVGGARITTLTVNSSVFNECTLLDAFVYLQGDDGGLCVAFDSKAQAEGFLASIGLKDIVESDDESSDSVAEISGDETSDEETLGSLASAGSSVDL